MSVEQPCVWKSSDVDVTTVERRLTELWKQTASAQAGRHRVRTRVFNLIVYTRTRDEAERAIDLLSRIPQRHPSRTIILIADRMSPTSSIDAELAVKCQEATNSGTSSCYERAVLTVHGRAAEHLASACIPLLVPQLATYLWWPGQPLFGHRLFHKMLALSDQLVVDSAQFDVPGDGLASLAGLCMDRYRVNDFHWARLTPWREVIAQFFDGPEMQPYANAIRSIEVEFGAGENRAGATAGMLLLLGWVGSRLDWEPETTLDTRLEHDTTLAVLAADGTLIPIYIRLRDHGSPAAGKLMACDMIAGRAGEPEARFQVRRSADTDHVEISIDVAGENRARRVLPIGLGGDVEILSDELEMTGQDNLYDSVVRAASRMAGREVLTPA